MVPWPSVVSWRFEHEWKEIRCSDCGEVLGHVASFDVGRLPETVFCEHCRTWRSVRCARCNLRLGASTASHGSVLVYCSDCASADLAARIEREHRKAVTTESDEDAIEDPGANAEADAW